MRTKHPTPRVRLREEKAHSRKGIREKIERTFFVHALIPCLPGGRNEWRDAQATITSKAASYLLLACSLGGTPKATCH